ncbi:MAG: glycosyltransferase, partial [Bacteroidales bacterium]|nr:glycosyltransferase [Bacteroidales bacterium]
MTQRTAVVILNWNGENFLRKFLKNIVENTDNNVARICIIDNASTDKSLEFVAENFPEIQIVKLG